MRILQKVLVAALMVASSFGLMGAGCTPTAADIAAFKAANGIVDNSQPPSGPTTVPVGTPTTGGGGGGGGPTTSVSLPVTNYPTEIGADRVRLSGSVSAPEGHVTTHWFQVGTDESLSSFRTPDETSTGNANFDWLLGFLKPGTHYYCRAFVRLGETDAVAGNQIDFWTTDVSPPPPSLPDWEQSMNEVRLAASEARSAVQTAWDAIKANDNNTEPRVAVARNSLARAQVIVTKGLEAASRLSMVPKPTDRQFDIWNAVNDLRGSIRNVLTAGGYQRYRIEGPAYNRIDRDGAPQPTGDRGKTAISVAASLKTTAAKVVAVRLGVRELTPSEALLEQLLTEGDAACSRALEGFKSDTPRYDASTAEKYLGESSTVLLFLWMAEVVSPAADPDGKYAERIKALQKRMPELLIKTLGYEQQVASKVGSILREADYALRQMFPFPSSPPTPVGNGVK